jgi:starvation-inducible DNA-binding protein
MAGANSPPLAPAIFNFTSKEKVMQQTETIAPKTALHSPRKDHKTVAASLQKVLAGTYGLYLTTQTYHWNVEGSLFVPLHSLFEDQYNELFKTVDVIAERIRSLGEYAMPFDDDNILQISKNTSNPLNKEKDATARSKRMVHNLIDLNDEIIRISQATKVDAQNIHDDETENLMVERITVHQKALWMLHSILK